MKKQKTPAGLFEFSILDGADMPVRKALRYFRMEILFAARLAGAHPRREESWMKLVWKAADLVRAAVEKQDSAGKAIAAAEKMLAPIGRAAKTYTVHCVGHAHIDMNWMWNWPETVATVNDTFSTMDRLLNEYPEFHFSQSQASVYRIMKEHLPELYERVKKHVRTGRWEITASQWVEGDRNLASGEALCRHMLQTRRFIRDEFGLPFDAVKIDWEPDTFGHAQTVPMALRAGGVRRYYFHRGADGPQLFWWESPDGSRVLAYDDRRWGYNGSMARQLASDEFSEYLLRFEKETGLRDCLFVYGVGDHGGGPTRENLNAAIEMDALPVFPRIKFSTTDAFFSIAEKNAGRLPVVKKELNFVLEGCYTSQSNVKHANRRSENALVEAEMSALLGRSLAGLPYPSEALEQGWRDALFNQFHDILPGSGVHATYEHAQGLYQEILARTGAIKTRALRAIAERVNTRALCPQDGGGAVKNSSAGGSGDIGADGQITRLGAASACCQPLVVFNPLPWRRTEMISTRLWNLDWKDEEIVVRDDAGNHLPVQVTERGPYWGHQFIGIAFPAKDIGGLGYRTFSVQRGAAENSTKGVKTDFNTRMENEFFRVEINPASGAICHLVDKRTGLDFVAPGEQIGLLEYLLEAPHPMTAWIFGQIVKRAPLNEGAEIDFPHWGPHLVSMRARHKFQESSLVLNVSLASGVPRVDFSLEINWLERGSGEKGVPMLKAAFPFALKQPVARYECPNGHVERSTNPADIPCHTRRLRGIYYQQSAPVDANPAEVPAQKWADLSGTLGGRKAGVTLLNDSKYGHRADGSTLRMTLLRSSYDPDPLPELGRHVIRFALRPHVGPWSPADATRAGYEFNLPCNVAGAGVQEGDLPLQSSFVEILTPNVMLGGMKKAEDSDAVVLRLYEMNGCATEARLRLTPVLAPAGARVVETDILEQPLPASTARWKDGVLSVKLRPFAMTTVQVGQDER
ncbi:MAG: glycoside hydrolase family 38 C-terminal domain-containing protein [Verrucomicrobiae bacterium]|nr:glycoside hydrolase family 38 C-terminal domain-containing protein [Verrucomicrobiae bacterium]